MEKSNRLKLYFNNSCGFLSLLSPLLPWMSYGVGSKTGIDIGDKPTYIIFIASFCLILFSFILFKTDKLRKLFLFLSLTASLLLLGVYLYEIIRISYQTMIAKSLPTEMFGVVSLSASQIKVGYGLWVGGGASLLSTIVNLISLRIKKPK
ncbi:hypothetical protein [Fluviispira multicolorata]|uniref:Uncharacterized protein n=1 Tax=Fluviispira multicolorata TaxID=2654512 RepID=A0A833N4B1_9BACT|nr:hypothetical protein [Fluviispira multicolorata]KAB8030651.1 hypothetical protein GCL57_06665 [Fluviispira multicolorata]